MSADLHLQTIPRELVHRRAVSEVYVTSLGKEGDNDFVVGAQLPRMHFFYGDHAGVLAEQHDPLIVMEAARQAAIAVVHQYFDAPLDSAFQVRTFNGTRAPGPTAAQTWTIGETPADLIMRVWTTRQHRRGDDLDGVDMVLDISCAGEPMFVVDGSFSWVTGQQWKAGRAAYRGSLGLGEFSAALPVAERADAAAVGRESRRNVVIGPLQVDGESAKAALVSDPTHPVMFDHPLDHVPGSLLIEAGRQTALAALLHRTGGQPASLERVGSSFSRFVELDAPAECVATVSKTGTDGTVIRCDVEQFGKVAARLDLTFVPGADSTGSGHGTVA